MKSILVSLFLTLSGSAALALPAAVELDRLLLHAKTALNDKSFDRAADHFVQAQKLGVALPEGFSLGYATALAGQGKANEAKAVLDRYLNKHGTKGASYKQVLELLVRLESPNEGASNPSQPTKAIAPAAAVTAARLPPRPQLPFAIDEALWRTLESSEMYRNTPTPQALRIRSVYEDSTVYTGSKTQALAPRQPYTITKETVYAPLSEKCQVAKTAIISARKNAAPLSIANYTCGGVGLGSGVGGQLSPLSGLGPLSGSLYPPRIGAKQRIQSEMRSGSNRELLRTTSQCEITGRMEARQLHARLTGTAWVVQCHNELTGIGGADGKPIISDFEDYLLEDLGVLLSAIGQPNMAEKRMFIPAPGSQSVLMTDGDYGARITSTYSSHDWAVGEPGDKPMASAAAEPVAGAGAHWGLADQDLSTLTGDVILTKVRMAENRTGILAAAQAGDRLSQYLIGASFLYGVGVGMDSAQQVVWLTKAAEQGLVRAKAALAIARIKGEGTPQDDISGWTLLLEASNAGNAVAQYAAAIFTLVGLDVGGGRARQFHFLEKPVALDLLRRSAQAGLSVAQYSLGHSLWMGTDLQEKDLTEARYWLEKAVAQNYRPAATLLARMADED